MHVSVSKLKAKLGQYMRAVRTGKEVVVTDRDVPVARLIPFEPPAAPAGVVIERPRDPSAPPLGAIRVRAIEYRGTDTTKLLAADRRTR